VVGNTHGALLLRAADTGKVLRQFADVQGGVEGAAMTADGKRLAAACGDGRVRNTSITRVFAWQSAWPNGRSSRCSCQGFGRAVSCHASCSLRQARRLPARR
jgi:hypothetical protein